MVTLNRPLAQWTDDHHPFGKSAESANWDFHRAKCKSVIMATQPHSDVERLRASGSAKRLGRRFGDFTPIAGQGQKNGSCSRGN